MINIIFSKQQTFRCFLLTFAAVAHLSMSLCGLSALLFRDISYILDFINYASGNAFPGRPEPCTKHRA